MSLHLRVLRAFICMHSNHACARLNLSCLTLSLDLLDPCTQTSLVWTKTTRTWHYKYQQIWACGKYLAVRSGIYRLHLCLSLQVLEHSETVCASACTPPIHVLAPSFHPAPHLPNDDLVAWCLHADVDQDCAYVIPALRMGIPTAMRMREVANGEVKGLTAALKPALDKCLCI